MLNWRHSPVKAKMANQDKNIVIPKFSGHDSFALRYGWLFKVAQEATKNSIAFRTPEEDMITYGVGKNMVVAMKHWAKSFGILHEGKLTEFGRKIFSDEGWDKYLEDEGTLWVLHWKLVSSENFNTIWWWAFNKYPEISFDKQSMLKSIKEFIAKKYPENKTVENSLKKDIDCFINTYVVKSLVKNAITENTLECPLAELGLIKEKTNKGEFKFQRNLGKRVPRLIFYYALTEYINNSKEKTKTLSLKSITYEANSPGRIFKLDESTIASYLSDIEKSSNNKYKWSDTSSMRQLQINKKTSSEYFLNKYYKK